jgi:hypothetical protein
VFSFFFLIRGLFLLLLLTWLLRIFIKIARGLEVKILRLLWISVVKGWATALSLSMPYQHGVEQGLLNISIASKQKAFKA